MKQVPTKKTARDRAKRKIKNYKLKHSRMLTCYSALLYLLHVYSTSGTVTVEDAKAMVNLTPTQRIERLANQLQDSKSDTGLRDLLKRYERFLTITSASEEELIALFQDNNEAQNLREEQSAFGDLAYGALLLIGNNSKFYRRLVV